jgi:RND family efflux transporter MFP subunit
MTMRRLLRPLSLLVFTALIAVADDDDDTPPAPTSAKQASPATLANPVSESSLTTVRLTPQAAKRIALRTAPVERKSFPGFRLFGGTIIAQPAAEMRLAAPVTGTLGLPAGANPLRVGDSVRRGQTLFAITPILAPEARASLVVARAESDAELIRVKAQLEPAKVASQRAERLLKDNAGSEKAADEAHAALQIAEAAIKAAEARNAALAQLISADGSPVPVPVNAPQEAVVRQILAAPGLLVNAAAPLVDLLASQRVWLRVPVYVGDIDALDTSAEARAGLLARRGDEADAPAKPIRGPLNANADAATVDLFYEIENTGQRFQPGQRVGMRTPTRAAADSLVVPASAILLDIHGGQWVYERAAENLFTRRRIQVTRIADGNAILASGPPVGARVVTEGANELFGVEFGAGK